MKNCRAACSLLEVHLALGMGMVPTLLPVAACQISAVSRHPLGMQQSLLQCQQCEHPMPVQASCPLARLNIYTGPQRGAPRQGKFEMFNLGMKTGDTVKVKGKISEDADNFSINLGSSFSDLAFHFSPRFNESVIVCNSRCDSVWQEEHRDNHFHFSKGSTVKIIIEMLADKFLVKLPDGHEVEFPNRHSADHVSYLSVEGGFRVTSFKLD
ncbi:galectin-2 isoform X1 [Falco naumanni]|uniref:galectin-2 isoform X1 n=2 Tax=Falco naumanni TaxID=148594 RepID=UPI001ADE9030|nr:galectin-2 isoform X1 [Falco naumanni]